MMNEVKKKGRGKGAKPALVYFPLRLEKYVVEHFDTHYPASRQAKIREVLANFIKGEANENHVSKEQEDR
jgi:hypothetical protein